MRALSSAVFLLGMAFASSTIGSKTPPSPVLQPSPSTQTKVEKPVGLLSSLGTLKSAVVRQGRATLASARKIRVPRPGAWVPESEVIPASFDEQIPLEAPLEQPQAGCEMGDCSVCCSFTPQWGNFCTRLPLLREREEGARSGTRDDVFQGDYCRLLRSSRVGQILVPWVTGGSKWITLQRASGGGNSHD